MTKRKKFDMGRKDALAVLLIQAKTENAVLTKQLAAKNRALAEFLMNDAARVEADANSKLVDLEDRREACFEELDAKGQYPVKFGDKSAMISIDDETFVAEVHQLVKPPEPSTYKPGKPSADPEKKPEGAEEN